MKEQVLSRVNRTTLREQALEHLRAGILDGTMPPGTRLAEVDLSDQLGVSRGTVREALRTLAEAGLVEAADRGMQVRELTAREVTELYQVRLALEKEALVRLLEQDDRERRIDLIEAALPPDEVPGKMTIGQRLDVDLRFHELICELSGNSMLLTMWRQLHDLTRVAVLGDSDGRNEALMKRAHHEPIVKALRTGDPDAAKDAIVKHMEAASQKWSEYAKQS